jgi:uncharacterized protein (DUF697 family)/predicted GTPase
MAIDPEKYGDFRDSLDDFVEKVIEEQDLDEGSYDSTDIGQEIIDDHVASVLDEYDDLLRGNRPPRLYILGSAGVGKSSLINSLANKQVASISHSSPETPKSKKYDISFPDRYSNWEVIDSRGLLEIKAPDGSSSKDVISMMRKDIEKYKPDVLLHVTTPDQLRSGTEEFGAIKDTINSSENAPPILTILNKVDTHLSPGGNWPPETNPELSNKIKTNLDFTSEVIADVVLEKEFNKEPFDKDDPAKGYQFDSKDYIGVVPVHAKEEPYWNIDTLSFLIGDYLPDDSRLQFFQAQERSNIMRGVASDLTKSSSKAAFGIGVAPLPYADIIPLTVLQYTQIALIAGLSCREVKLKTVTEFIGSLGVISGSAIALRKAARGLIQFIPIGGQIASGTIAGAGTYAMGKSAEKYFFDGVVEEPDSFMDEGKEIFDDFDQDSEQLNK